MIDLKSAAIAALGFLLAVVSVFAGITDKRLDKALTDNAVLTAEAEANAAILQAVEASAKSRAEASQAALRAAQDAGKADRQASVTYLTLPTPAPEQRCEAVSDLVDRAIKENRQ